MKQEELVNLFLTIQVILEVIFHFKVIFSGINSITGFSNRCHSIHNVKYILCTCINIIYEEHVYCRFY